MTSSQSGAFSPQLETRERDQRFGIALDASAQRFLADHLVDSRPLLSTVMGLEAIGCAVSASCPGTPIAAIGDVEVGPPCVLPPAGRGGVEVRVEPAATTGNLQWCEVWSRPAAGPGVRHYRAAVSLGAPGPAAVGEAARCHGPGVAADAVYGLYFHGPSFRVLASGGFAGQAMVGVLARGLPPIIEPARPSVTAPLLTELCLQTAGLWELATSGAMRIPAGIERIVRLTDADSGDGRALRAVVTPRAEHVFDATVFDDDDRPHLVVQGYRTVEFGHPHDETAAARIRSALNRT